MDHDEKNLRLQLIAEQRAVLIGQLLLLRQESLSQSKVIDFDSRKKILELERAVESLEVEFRWLKVVPED